MRRVHPSRPPRLAREGSERERGKEGKRERERGKKKRAFQFGHKRPLTNVVFFFLLKGEKAPPFRWISDLPAMTTVPESPSLLLRFLDRATGFRRKRPPPFRGSRRFVSRGLLSFLPFLLFLRVGTERDLARNSNPRERDIYTRHTRETQASISRVQKKKEAVRTFFILDLRFHVVDRVRRLHLERDRLPGQRFHENLHCFSCCCCSLLSRARVLSNE